MAKKVGIALVAFVAVFFAASFAVDRVMLDNTFKRVEPASLRLYATYDAYAQGHPRSPVEFEFQEHTLRGYVYEARDPKAFIVFRHGIFSQHADYLALICAMVDRGYTVFAYDAIGCGDSDGDDVRGMAQSPLDVAAAVQFVRETELAGNLPLVLWGHSWGGYGVAAALDLVPDVDACITMSGYDKPADVLLETAIEAMGPVAATQGPTLWLVNKLDFGSDADRTALDGINKTKAPVLVIHGAEDATVHFDGSAIIAQRERITNPGVQYLVFDEPGRDGHNTYFSTAEAGAYLAEKHAELEGLQEEYPDGLPADVQAAFLDDYDVVRANEPNPQLIDGIDGFLSEAIGTQPNAEDSEQG